MITKQFVLLAVGAGLALSMINGAIAAENSTETKMTTQVKIPKYKNEDFYKDGVFQVEKAKAAYFEMMAKYGYPVPESLRTNMWATDFGLGDFVNVGMAGVFWINQEKEGYFAHEIYLLPGQMIVEHGHVATGKVKAKMESWHVRYGQICTFGEEGGSMPAGVSLPKSQEKFITVKKCNLLQAGEVGTLNRLEAKHFMLAGPAGAIVSEYGTPHDGDALRFTNPSVKF